MTYYEKEQVAYPEAHETKIPFAVAEKIIRHLAAHNGVKIGTIVATHGRNYSCYQTWDRKIVLNCGGSAWARANGDQVRLLTAVHEFAHAADAMGRERAGLSVIDGSDKRWHSATHAGHVRFAIGIVHAEGLVARFTAEVAQAQAQAKDREVARAAREAARNTPLAVRARKIERRRAQVTKMERRIKMLTTRLVTARRSLAALERAERKAAQPPEVTP